MGEVSVSDDDLKLYQAYLDEFNSHLDMDLHTPQAMALLWKVVKDKNLPASLKVKFMDEADTVFALDLAKVEENKAMGAPVIDDAIKALVEERKAARVAKDWKKSDEIRDKLLAQGIVLKDLPNNEVEISIK